MSDYLYFLIPVAGAGLVYLVRKLRELQWGWVRNPERSLQGKIFIVTGKLTFFVYLDSDIINILPIPGANTGLGFETTKALLRRNATVIMACRDINRATEAAMTIRKTVAEGTFVSLKASRILNLRRLEI